MEAKYHNVLTGRMIKTDGVVFKNLTKNAVILQSRIRRLINKPPEKPLIVAKPTVFTFNDMPDDVLKIITYQLYNSMTIDELRKILRKLIKEGHLTLCGFTKWKKQKLIRKIIDYPNILEKHKKKKEEKQEKPKKEKPFKIGITDLLFTYDQFDAFYENVYGWGHSKQSLPFRKILTDYKGEELVEGDIIATTASERKRMMGGSRYDYSFRLRFKTQKFDYVEFIVNCDEDDEVLYQLVRASGIDPYGEGFKITDEGRISTYEDEEAGTDE
jgi:hypothetical protein